MGGRERSAAFLAAVTTPSALRGDVEGMANDVAFAKLSIQTASGIGTTARCASSDLHTCLMTEEVMEIQVKSHVTGMPGRTNNTCLEKHLDSFTAHQIKQTKTITYRRK
jgi:hypothetical protein